MIGHIFLPQGPIQSPFSFIWQTAAGLNLFYILILGFLLTVSHKQALEYLVSYVDPTLQVINYEEASYGDNCDLIAKPPHHPLKNIYDTAIDIFSVAHFGGWFLKTLICRDVKLVLFASVSF